MTFYAWLSRQTARQDDIGVFARYAMKDRVFPAPKNGDADPCGTLHLCLLRYEGMPEQRASVKRAHREFRRWRKGQEQQQTLDPEA